jgi:terminase small subunit
MALLRDQKKLQKQFYKEQEGEPAQKDKKSKSKPRGPAPKSSKIKEQNNLVQAELDRLKGLPIEEKITIKKALVEKYKADIELLLSSKELTEYSLLLNAYIIWLFDTGDIEGFLRMIDYGIALSQKQKIIPQKDYQLLKLYWIMDWTAEQRDQGLPWEPYFSQVFKTIKDWKQPKRIREGYWYFYFYTLLAQGKKKQAEKIGDQAIEHGAGIKSNLVILRNILKGKYKKKWDAQAWKFA